MSETATIQTQFKNEPAILAAAAEMELPVPVRGTVDLYQTKGHSGMILKFPGWRYPVVIDTTTGSAAMDTYNGKWGYPQDLQRFTQLYGFHAAKALALRQGKTVTRKVKPDGTLQLIVNC